ncbi:MAG: hypothetical protein Hyperionvirus1_68 [Hyperionvirus sp.]|uniref:Uncharacterized protein n=1 Tax=Hyperionvirus sp. TaxID=2487770 RepID=A0A3G5AAZ6_9VIRU|nr:MAG: hypothetical protein Hyperionvirus1_68 [Hyperionvirus sp.]
MPPRVSAKGVAKAMRVRKAGLEKAFAQERSSEKEEKKQFVEEKAARMARVDASEKSFLDLVAHLKATAGRISKDELFNMVQSMMATVDSSKMDKWSTMRLRYATAVWLGYIEPFMNKKQGCPCGHCSVFRPSYSSSGSIEVYSVYDTDGHLQIWAK